jgi:nitroreductase/NAD-dependent dihydropyrimidine dehydrogenase PreA subunit
MFFSVDYEKCNQDSLCSLVCPAKIIEMQDQGPVAIDGAEEACIRCGHCVAICPEAALQLDFLAPESCLPIDDKLQLSVDHVEHFLRSRRSIRAYRQKPVPKAVLEQVLAIASSAPTGSNRQPVKWMVVHEKDKVQAVAGHVIDWMRSVQANQPELAEMFNMARLIGAWENGIDRICRDAPHLLFTYTTKEVRNGSTDCHTAIAYLELALPSFNLGSCWAGYVNFAASNWPPLADFLGFSVGFMCQGAVMVGYPKFDYKRIPKRNTPDITYK